MIFSKIKAYIYLGIGLLVTSLIAAVKFLASRNKTLKRKVKTSDARVKHAKAVITSDVEADEQEDIHLAEVTKEIEDEKHPSELSDPNDW